MRLNPDLDAEALSRVLDEKGRVQIREFVHSEDAEQLYDAIRTEKTGWIRTMVMYPGDDIARGDLGEVPLSEFEALAPEKKEKFYAYIRQTARENKLQYCYDKIKITEAVKNGEMLSAPLKGVHDFMSGAAFRKFFELVAGTKDPILTHLRAHRYLSGHFLMPHNDNPSEYETAYAWVLTLNPIWRTPWGGLLQFIDEEGMVSDTFFPLFNTLNVFRIPQRHTVSYVTPFAAEPRYACAGWLCFNPKAPAVS